MNSKKQVEFLESEIKRLKSNIKVLEAEKKALQGELAYLKDVNDLYQLRFEQMADEQESLNDLLKKRCDEMLSAKNEYNIQREAFYKLRMEYKNRVDSLIDRMTK